MEMQECYRSNHFELVVDNNDDLRLNCMKVSVNHKSRFTEIQAKFYLLDRTVFIIKSEEFCDSNHNINLRLYSPDASNCISLVSGVYKVDCISYNTAYDNNSAFVVTVTFLQVA